MTLTVWVFVWLATVLFYNCYWKRRNYPPGPMPLPIVGNLLAFGNWLRWEEKFLMWKQRYGDVYTIWLGEQPFVTINSYATAQRYAGDAFTARFNAEEALAMTRGGNFGLVDSWGDQWREQRRFTLRTLRDFGLGKSQMQQRILDEVSHICDCVTQDIANGVAEHDFYDYTDIAVGSIMNTLVCGQRLTVAGREHEFHRLKKLCTHIMQYSNTASASFVFLHPWALHVPMVGRTARLVMDRFNELFEHLASVVRAHQLETEYVEGMEPRDFIDAFMLERRRLEYENDPRMRFFSDRQLVNACLDLWFAGQETTSTTLHWAVAYMIAHPNIQTRLQAELDRVIGSSRLITTADRLELPYTNAVIAEIQRLSNIFGFNIPRLCTEEVLVEGYRLPKGTPFIPQVSVMLSDPQVFRDPHEFNPDRFMVNGKFRPMEEFVPFSIGKRACMGESLARMELFLFCANIFNRFRFAAGDKAPTLLKASANSAGTELYRCRIEKRHDD